ncbi:hypothetical protein [Ligilactobacillus ceti]|uniref:Uncharacterized protein n=1 Tax=Ligilactobacillus ceti DSM 22408 TaxID=1122146 RepID=A0A0R2KQ65_9LACO|nr:hypothetical protein [Ligilactobacillus ceti]KRN88372.1 hypothetical protein IV53_GL000336 [Ligilactobacillus ceti DSM 22408]
MRRKYFEKYLNNKVELALNKQLPKYIKTPGGMVSSTAYTKGRLTNILDNDGTVFLELNRECKINIEQVKAIKIQEDRNDIVDGKLITPFGELKTYLDGKEVSYKIKEQEVSICFPDVEAIYSLTIKLPVDNNEHIVSCNIHQLNEYNYECEYVTDEYELTLNIENEQYALAIGCNAANCEEEIIGYYNDGFYNQKHLNQKYLRYSSTTSIAEFCDNGIQYKVFDFSQRGYVVFGISWIKEPGIYSSNKKNYNDRSFQAEFAASLNSHDESWENADDSQNKHIPSTICPDYNQLTKKNNRRKK